MAWIQIELVDGVRVEVLDLDLYPDPPPPLVVSLPPRPITPPTEEGSQPKRPLKKVTQTRPKEGKSKPT